MPLYLVRWPDLSVALVKARNEDELLMRLDEYADPTGCQWMVYRGDVFLDFSIPIKIKRNPTSQTQQEPLTDNQLAVDVESISNFDGGMLKLLKLGDDLESSIMEYAFPHLNSLWNEYMDELIEGRIDTKLRNKVRSAALRDLQPYVQASWHIKNMERSDDPVDRIARMAGTSSAVIKQFIPKGELPDKPSPPRKAKLRKIQPTKRKKRDT
ncbi:MAG TPA: hypothetical protein VF815_10925 [Myxococcaceae bacterium]|jgi:hypothetical protein